MSLHQKAANRTWKIAAALIGLCGAALLLIVFTLLASTRANARRPRRAAYWAMTTSPLRLRAILEKTRDLRERWGPWASRHREDLRQMLLSAPDDPGALMRVYDELPGGFDGYRGAGFGASDLFQGPVQYSNRTGSERMVRLWRSLSAMSDPVARRRQAAELTFSEKSRAHNFRAFRDIAYVISQNNGPTHYTLWVSGRITETTCSLYSKQDPYLEATERETVPPYDFLR